MSTARLEFPGVYEQDESVVVRAEGNALVIELVDARGVVTARATKPALDVAVALDNGALGLGPLAFDVVQP
jgi:hypothetical protein